MGLGEVWERFHFLNRVILATSEEDQPRLRPVTLIHLDGRFLITTGNESKKVDHILKNPKVEFLMLLLEDGNTGYVRGRCVASILDDKDIKRVLYEKIPHVSQLWEGPEDEDLTIIELEPVEYDYMRQGDFFSTIIPA
ncbi:pyridoxamine 5'-phosphate oxidase family protein [Candidatus Bathyarchaeota archaeon]|nr:pyridoxamine 5'-phosphate oxidase family protein [Candidatus Bathyarchaeota archaeon]